MLCTQKTHIQLFNSSDNPREVYGTLDFLIFHHSSVFSRKKTPNGRLVSWQQHSKLFFPSRRLRVTHARLILFILYMYINTHVMSVICLETQHEMFNRWLSQRWMNLSPPSAKTTTSLSKVWTRLTIIFYLTHTHTYFTERSKYEMRCALNT